MHNPLNLTDINRITGEAAIKYKMRLVTKLRMSKVAVTVWRMRLLFSVTQYAVHALINSDQYPSQSMKM